MYKSKLNKRRLGFYDMLTGYRPNRTGHLASVDWLLCQSLGDVAEMWILWGSLFLWIWAPSGLRWKLVIQDYKHWAQSLMCTKHTIITRWREGWLDDWVEAGWTDGWMESWTFWWWGIQWVWPQILGPDGESHQVLERKYKKVYTRKYNKLDHTDLGPWLSDFGLGPNLPLFIWEWQ